LQIRLALATKNKVTIGSGNKLFIFSKEDLKYPVYKVGDEVLDDSA